MSRNEPCKCIHKEDWHDEFGRCIVYNCDCGWDSGEKMKSGKSCTIVFWTVWLTFTCLVAMLCQVAGGFAAW